MKIKFYKSYEPICDSIQCLSPPNWTQDPHNIIDICYDFSHMFLDISAYVPNGVLFWYSWEIRWQNRPWCRLRKTILDLDKNQLWSWKRALKIKDKQFSSTTLIFYTIFYTWHFLLYIWHLLCLEQWSWFLSQWPMFLLKSRVAASSIKNYFCFFVPSSKILLTLS